MTSFESLSRETSVWISTESDMAPGTGSIYVLLVTRPRV